MYRNTKKFRNDNIANECCCQTTTNKTKVVIYVVVMILLLKQNHFWKDPSLLHYRSTCGEIEKEDATKVMEKIQH